MKKVLSLVIVLALVLSVVPAMAEDAVVSSVLINGEEQSFKAVNGYLPLRGFVDAVGATVEWDNDNRCAVCVDGGVEIKVPIGKAWVQRAGLKQSLKSESVILNDLTYMPLEALKAFNASYGGDESIITIEKSAFDGKLVKLINNDKALSSDETGSNVVMLPIAEDDNQVWRFVNRGNDAYRLQNKKTNKAIDVPSDSKDAGKTLIQYAMTGGGNQNYVMVRNTDGTYFVQCYNSKLYMTIAADGTITQEELTQADNQKFTLEVVGGGETSVEFSTEDTIVDKEEKETIKLSEVNYGESEFVGGKYVNIMTLEGSFLMLHEETNEIHLQPNTTGINLMESDIAQWEAVAVGSTAFTLINKKTGKAIDVPNESKEAGVKLSQYTSNKKDHQVYSIEAADVGFRLKNKNSGMYITIKDGVAYQEEKAETGQIFGWHIMGESDTKMVAITATPFILKGDEAVTNVKLQWNEVIGAKKYDIYRSVDDGEYELIAAMTGFTVDDYDLEVGKSYTYRVYALDDNGLIGYAQTKEYVPYEMPMDMKSTTNLEPSGMSTPGGGMRDKDGVYYRFSQTGRTDGGKGFGQVTLSTSTDGVNYTDPVIIMTVDDILAHETCKDLKDIRFESVNFKYNPKANNFGFIAHAEPGSGGYDFARISVATYTPGDEKMVFHGCVRPGGDDIRDLNTFIDDDGTGYIMGATHGNADLGIYRLKEDWSGIEKRIVLLNPGKWRELPNILKVDDYYYLFTSGCAGWYPTPGMYNSATNMEGPWSDLRNVGNLTTFSSQSGYGFYLKKDSTNYIMNSYRWMDNWKDATVRTTQSLRLPITVSDGYAFYDYFEELLYNWEEDVLVPVQRGRNLSQGKPTSYGKNANDGNYKSQWSVDTAWPYSWEVDLGHSYNINQVQISWLIRIGSEPYYNYIIEGSEDGVNYTTLVDKSKGYTDYGFTVDNCMGKARYVKVTVTGAKPRSGENNYPSTFYEIKVFVR